MTNDRERQSRLSIDLGGEQIGLLRLDASEALSQPFVVSVDMLSQLSEIDLLPHLGKSATVSIYEDGNLLRYFNGIIVDGAFEEEIGGAGFVYRLTLRPKAFLYDHGEDFRIFQNETVKSIIDKVLSERGIAFDLSRLTGTYRVRAYCVQYGESDVQFVQRLMEEEGLYYFYHHTNDSHTLIICDSPRAHRAGKSPTLTYNPDSADIYNADSDIRFDRSTALSFIQEWKERVSTGAEASVTLYDFDFQQPEKERTATARQKAHHPLDEVEIHSFPGRFYDDGDGQSLGETLLASRRANRRSYSGSSRNASLACGTTFTLKHADIPRFEQSYLLTRCDHSIRTEAFRSAMGGESGQTVQFEAVPADTVWKAPRTTRRPIVSGPETAIVTGPTSEEIYCDEYARVRVHFHWDRKNQKDENSSCWIRVSQTGGLGNLILPRVGHEVIVDFINGDPDRPVIVGRLFNKAHMPAYDLPEHKTRALWRSERYGAPGDTPLTKALDEGGWDLNEIRLEDKGGSEEIFIYAQRDLNTRVVYRETHHVGNDRETRIGNDQKIDVANDSTEDIHNNLKITVGNEVTITAETSITLQVGTSSIKITQNSISLESAEISTNATARSNHQSGGTMDVVATGVTTVRGALITLN